MSTTITCYGSVGEIGGNKILLEDGERRLLFDFGKAFGRYGAYFDGVFIKERLTRGLLDPLALGLVPPLRGLLREDLVPALRDDDVRIQELAPTGRQRKPRQIVELEDGAVDSFWEYFRQHSPGTYRDLRREHALPVDLILLSHAHQDHISDLEYVSPDIPAGSTCLTAFISKVLIDVGQAGRSGAPFVNPRLPDAHGLLQSARDLGYISRPWVFLDGEPRGELGEDPLQTAGSFWATPPSKSLEPRRGADVPGLQLQHWPVDHSLFGAMGAAVETEAGWVGYTGDMRFHGQNGPKTWAFADGLALLKPTVLLCEGTRLTEPNRTTETEVYENCLRAVAGVAGQLVVVDFAPRNIERLMVFDRIAAETGRRLLVQPRDAYLLRAMVLADPSLPDVMQDPHVGLYDDPKARQNPWETWVRERYRSSTHSPEDVAREPGDYILAFSLTDAPDLLDLQLILRGTPGGLYVFSNSQAYDDEQKVDLLRLWNWTKHLGLKVVGLVPRFGERGEVTEVVPEPGYHASGHAGSDELVEFVRRVRPRTLVPIHTERPDLWADLIRGTGVRVVIPEVGRPIPV